MPETAVGDVRLLIADVDPDRQILTDDQLGAFLRMAGGEESWHVRRAAADALEAIAVSEVLVGKVIRTQDLSTDGAKVAAELRALAAAHRKRAAEDEEAAEDEDGEGLFTVLEFHPRRR